MFVDKVKGLLKAVKDSEMSLKIIYDHNSFGFVIIHKETEFEFDEDCIVVTIDKGMNVSELIPLNSIKTIQFTTTSCEEMKEYLGKNDS